MEPSLDAITRSASRRRHRPSAASRRIGYIVSVFINLALWYAVIVWPGWSVLPFLTSATPRVLPVLIASFIVGAAVNLVWFVRDPTWLTAAGNGLIALVAVVVGVRVWQVFPFDFGSTPGWALVVRVLLGIGIAGAVIGALAWFTAFVAAVDRREKHETQPAPR